MGVLAAGSGVGVDVLLVRADGHALEETTGEVLEAVTRGVQVGGVTATAVNPQAGAVGHRPVDVQERVVTNPGRVAVGAPHVLRVEATGIAHGHTDLALHVGRVQEARERTGVNELLWVVVREVQGRSGTHRQTDNRVTGLGQPLVGQEGGQLLGQEGLPLVGEDAILTLGRLVPVGVPAGLAADGHDDGDTGLVVVLERRGLDVPAAEVIARTQTVQQVDGLGATVLELDLDAGVHGRRGHLQVLDRKTRARERVGDRGTTGDTDESRQNGRSCGHSGKSTRGLTAQL
ncbi:Uncharacterised protein [Mycobacteroides abscessus subsp. abscessus]|nr:Uncharacterised protein [Mycobacteroides abscessus subsp. abscessus]